MLRLATGRVARGSARVHGLGYRRAGPRRTLANGWFGGKGSPAAGAEDAASAVAAAASRDEGAPAGATASGAESDAAASAAWEALQAAPAAGAAPVEAAAEVPLAAAEAVAAALPLTYSPGDLALRYVDALACGLDISHGAAIVGATLILRSAMFPLSLVTMKHTARMQKAKPELEVLQERMNADDAAKTDRRKTDMYQRQMAALLKKHEVKPYLIFAFPLAQMPIFMSMFFGLRRLGDHFPEEAAVGGFGWFTDLTVADPYYALPCVTAGLFLAMVEVGADGMAAQSAAQQTMFRNVMRGMGVMMIPMTASFPTSVFCYWISANAFSLGQTVLLNKVPGVREALGVPKSKPPEPKVRKAGAPEEPDVFARLAAAADTAKKAATGEVAPPPVSAADFAKKTDDNAFLASRPHAAVETHTARPGGGTSGGGKRRKGRSKRRRK